MATTTTERTQPTPQQLERIRRINAESKKVLADFLDANPKLKQHFEKNYRAP